MTKSLTITELCRRTGLTSRTLRFYDQRELVVAIRALDGEMALVSIADTGPGISPDVADRHFQPFITTKRTGMGVGLSISRTIVESHGGRIWVEPNEGGGAVFRFTVGRVAREELSDDC